MKKMRKRVFSFIALFVLLFALNLFSQAIRDMKPTVILISLDCALL
jgi:ABC-type microcin C transport system permease subunit YejE